MSFSPVGDTYVILKLACQLYRRGIVVAINAPAEFSELITHLTILKGVLHKVQKIKDTIKDDPNHDDLGCVLSRCYGALQEFSGRMKRYENLDCSDKGNFARRLLWAKEKSHINDFKEQLNRELHLLHIILEVDGRLQALENAQRRKATQTDQQHAYLIPTQTTQATDDPAERNDSLSSTSTNCFSCRESLQESLLTELDDDEPPDIEAANDTPSEPRSMQAWRPVTNRQPVGLGSAIATEFEQNFDPIKDKFTSEDWLRLAIWWLVKSQTISRLLTDNEQAPQEDSFKRSRLGWESDANAVQEYADRLKSVWILQKLLDHKTLDLDNTQIRRLVTQLQKGSKIRLVDADAVSDKSSVTSQSEKASTLGTIGHKSGHAENLRFPEKDILECRLDLLEDFQQMIEDSDGLPQPIDEASPSWRWFEIDRDHCGYENESVVHRTFVDAQLGFRKQRQKPTSAPYLLLLWTAKGQSGLNISLCNHRGTLNLSRRLLFEDIEDRNGQRGASLVLVLKFDKWDAEICFLTSSDYYSFLELPSRFFSSEQRDLRDPRNGEMAICQSSLISCHDESVHTRHERPRDVHFEAGRTSSCGLKLFETSTNHTWETTRRLVVFSPPDLNAPNICTESYWIPPDQVQISIQDQNITLQWSDYQQVRKTKTDTREDRPFEPTLYYTYTYDAEQPNKKLCLKFISSAAARKFQEVLLLPTEIPNHVTSLLCIRNGERAQEIRVYRLEAEGCTTFAICLTTTVNMHKKKSVIRYVYRDLDWILECDPIDKIRFPVLTASTYTASPSRLTHEPGPDDKAPEFRGVKQVEGSLEIEAACQHSIPRIMEAMTSWELVASARASKVETPARVGSHSHKGASLQLWQRKAPSGLQLAIRFDEQGNDRWVTAPIGGFPHASNPMKNTLTLMGLSLTRGRRMDSQKMTATNSPEMMTKPPALRSKVAIHFKDERHRERFMPSFSRLVK